jgi:hypothetical protein
VPKSNVVGRSTTRTGATPEPEINCDCGLSGEPAVTVSSVVTSAVRNGLNRSPSAALAPGARSIDTGQIRWRSQVPLKVNSSVMVDSTSCEIWSGAVPALVTWASSKLLWPVAVIGSSHGRSVAPPGAILPLLAG